MQERRLDEVVQHIQEAIKAEDYGKASALLFPALDQHPNVAPLYFYGGVLLSMEGRLVPAFEMFRRSQELSPHPANWSNMGGALRQLGRVEEARALLLKGLDVGGADMEILSNLGGSYVNEGEPHKGIEYCERALELDPQHGGTLFNLAMLHLEAGHFDKGFDLYAEGFHKHRGGKVYEPDPPTLTPQLFQELRGQGKKLIVYGEQGMGDEMMLATLLGDARKDFEIIYECHARLEKIFRTSSWATSDGYPIHIYPTRKEHGDETVSGAGAHAKVALGNLARYYRRSREDFPWNGSVYSADPTEVIEIRGRLEELACGRKIIGLALRGGTMSTARTYRMLPPQVLDALFKDPRYLFVSLDYEDMSGFQEWMRKTYGGARFLAHPARFIWNPSICWHWDYSHVASLIAATDAVITVCQTVAHLSAAMGHPTYVMTPSRPAWRYGLTGETWYWYPHSNVRLLRQVAEDWRPTATELVKSLEARFFEGVNPLWPHEQVAMESITAGKMCELGIKRGGEYRTWFLSQGFEHVAIDLNGEDGALALDLNQPVPVEQIGGPFDVVTNFGTTEHVEDQLACWRNVHSLVKLGGYLVSTTPHPGDWPKHGRWYPSRGWYRQFCAKNGYVIEDQFVVTDRFGEKTNCLRARKTQDLPFTMPKKLIFRNDGGGEEKVGAYSTKVA